MAAVVAGCTEDQKNDFFGKVHRSFPTLKDGNKQEKRKMLNTIKKELQNGIPLLSTNDLQLLGTDLMPYIIMLVSDNSEACRELSVEIISIMVEYVENVKPFLSLIFPVLVRRLGQQDIVEPSEEVRLGLVNLIILLIQKAGNDIRVYLDDIICILQRALADNFQDIKKSACAGASLVAETIPRDFHLQSENLIKPLVGCISHQHFKVRVAVIEAIGKVIQYGNNKSVDDVVSHFAQRTFDPSLHVRLAITTVVGGWLLDLCDRYSYHHKLIPLLLTGLDDEVPENRRIAQVLWHDVGLKYLKENEDLKDKVDFPRENSKHYPPEVERPNLGCLTLMARNIGKILPGAANDIKDWRVETRVTAARLVFWLLLNVEEQMTQHLQTVLLACSRACDDVEPDVQKAGSRAATLIGYFVEKQDIWLHLVLKQVRMSEAPGSLCVLAHALGGSASGSLRELHSVIMETLLLPEVCESTQVAKQQHLCLACSHLLRSEDITDVALPMYRLLVTMLVVKADPPVEKMIRDNLHSLANVVLEENFASVESLHARFLPELLEYLKSSLASWTSCSFEWFMFETVLMEAGPAIGDCLDKVVFVFVKCLHPDKSPEIRLKLFTLLSKLLCDASTTLNSLGKFPHYAKEMLEDVILPNCIWRAGRTAAAIRTTAVASLWSMFRGEVLTADVLLVIREELLTRLISLLDDDNRSTRLICCHALARLFTTVAQKHSCVNECPDSVQTEAISASLDQHRLHNLYPALLKRLDDASQEVRLATAQTFLSYFDCFEDGYDKSLYSAHLEAIYRGLLIHLDDPESPIQEAILDVLKRSSLLHPELMEQEMEAVRYKHRSQRSIFLLSEHLQTLRFNSSANS